jgi:hypothetical protein
MPCLGWRCITGTGAMRLKLLFLVISVYNLICTPHPSSAFWVKTFDILKGHNEWRCLRRCIYIKKEIGSQSGLPGSPEFRRANSSAGFYLDPDRS